MASPTSQQQQQPQNSVELNVFVEDMLQQMQSRLDSLGKKITGRMEEMGKRIDELETTIRELVEQAGLDKDAISHPPPKASSSPTAMVEI